MAIASAVLSTGWQQQGEAPKSANVSIEDRFQISILQRDTPRLGSPSNRYPNPRRRHCTHHPMPHVWQLTWFFWVGGYFRNNFWFSKQAFAMRGLGATYPTLVHPKRNSNTTKTWQQHTVHGRKRTDLWCPPWSLGICRCLNRQHNGADSWFTWHTKHW